MNIYGWNPDIPDFRDYKFSRPSAVQLLPPSVNLQSTAPPVLDQGQLGSCTANAISNCHRFVQRKEGHKELQPSRLFIYYNERKIEGTIGQDSGAQIRDGFKTIANEGVCDEKHLPYDISRFTRKPTAKCYTEALAHTAVQYQRLDNTKLDDLRACLAAGYPFVFGFSVYESFESSYVAHSGNVQMPSKTEKLLGGHAVLAVGYDDAKKQFHVQNSWGTGWGLGGFFNIPYDYLTNANLADDFWTLRIVK